MSNDIIDFSSSPPPYSEPPSTTTNNNFCLEVQLNDNSNSSKEKQLVQRKFCSDADDFEDETLLERLIGLTEMFPECLRNSVCSLSGYMASGANITYSLSRNISWFIASTATLCFLPLFLELERVQTEEQEAVHQRSMMLGPRAASAGTNLAGFSAALPNLTQVEAK